MLKVSELAASYGMHEALSGISLQVEHREIVVILGANGAGKSTLLKAIAGICEGVSGGDVSLDGRSLNNLNAEQIVEAGIAFVPEGRGIFGDLTVQENLLLGAYAEHARDRQTENLDRVLTLFPKLAERKKQIARTMSGGEQQMVAIGRALMSAPTVLMLDEPSLGLSPLLCKELFSSLMQVRETGVGILLVEQNAKQSLGIADRGYLLENGSIVGEDSAESLLHDPAVQAAYLGGAAAAAVSGQVKTKSVMPAKPAVKKVASTTTTVSPEHFLPETSQRSTVSADALIDDDIGAMVARASSAAAEERVSPLSASGSVSTLNQTTSPQQTASQSASPAASAVSLPPTQDARVQQLLAEFESAARAAASGGDHTRVVDKSARHSVQDDLDNLPHIPVIRKSLVTVYRRDGSGVLRKQERR
jgi:branched-chain amino acid transport system ATP-binding protein